MPIIASRSATITATLKVGGVAIPISPTDAVTAQLFTGDGLVPIGALKALSASAIGANWPLGVVVADFADADTIAVTPPQAVVRFTLTSGAQMRSWDVAVAVELANATSGSALFPNKQAALAALRRDRLVLAGANALGDAADLSDDYVWSKLLAAEAEMSRTLRVKFQPTQFFAATPTQAQIDALGAMPWEEDPAYDYDPEMFQGDRWGFINTNNRPIISVQSLRYAYPSQASHSFEIPMEWLRLDKKYGQVRIVPSSVASIATSGAFMMQIIGAGRMIPHVMQLTYVAGLTNAARDFPDLLDAVKKSAVLKIVEDCFLPQSGSISADGLSQSMSVDMDKYHEVIDRMVHGRPGSNGGLMAAIHGVRMAVL